MPKLVNTNQIKAGDRVLEPSAGKGDIVDCINDTIQNKAMIDVVEIESELQHILYGKNCNVVAEDFLKFETYTEYDHIIMNPPFSEGAKHLLKAIEIAERSYNKDTSISCILNAETIRNQYSSERQYLANKLAQYGASIEYIQDAFAQAERRTGVEIAIIKLTVKRTGSNFFKLNLEEYDKVEEGTRELSLNVSNPEIEKRKKEIYLLVDMYDEHVKKLKKAYKEVTDLKQYDDHLASVSKGMGIEFGQRTYVYFENIDLDESITKVRYAYWKLILNSNEFQENLTEKGKEELFKTISETSNLEITIDNVNKILMSIYQNSPNILKSDAMNLFERLTKNHMSYFSKNIHYYNGWKTNEAFKVNHKIIMNTTEFRGEHCMLSYNGWLNWENGKRTKLGKIVNDLTKVLQNFTDKEIPTDFIQEDNVYENDFFKLQVFKKGTTHITFKDQDALDRFNIFCGIESGMLPTEEEVKNNEEAREFMVKTFGESSIKLLGGD